MAAYEALTFSELESLTFGSFESLPFEADTAYFYVDVSGAYAAGAVKEDAYRAGAVKGEAR